MTDPPAGYVIAVVDDDQGVLGSLGLLMESAGHDVRLFSSAGALLESGCVAELHGLISDIGMPGMDGLQLSRAIHAARPGLPIILITGQSGPSNQSPPIVAPHCRVLKKPLDGEELLTIIDDALRNSDLPAL